ncbi:MAG: hypothetical protein HKO75_10165 [Flavobacteriaceae bacterium]|nr:hypothetical protein [Muriicola sp.]NNC60981.1 hypothetical protein [Eudoraea sp.]NNK20833.1 hypothetical protein [Flavobacteriaceae bacterium]MBT8290230.1 hypothetical protein [Muriicola sp.]NNK35424.1 hypothetical protein [Eudoraea sp.]
MIKNLLPLASLLLFLVACKTEKKIEIVKEENILEKVAKAHGIENWNKIQQIRFTFNVDRDTMHFEREWTWNTKTQEVRGISRGDTILYNRKAVDSLSARADAAFINDKYWLLAPINILWDKDNLTYTYEERSLAPISKDSLPKLTVVYGNDGGYTPGDAYDFYLSDDHLVKEWNFRKGNSDDPTSSATWEGYEEVDGLKISTMHKNAEGNFSLYFTDVEVLK